MLEQYVKKILTSRVYDVAVETPLQPARQLTERLGNQILLKREDLQPVYSFKIRGAYNKLAQLTPEELERGVVTASAGNHAQGVALAAKHLGVKATIVMPRTTPELKVQGVRSRGGKVVLHGDAFPEALAHSLKLVEEKGYTYIHPYDDPLVIAGQGTAAMEILRQQPGQLDAIFVPVGGGGLIAGIAAYVKYLRPEIKVIGVEPDDSNCLQAAMAAGERVVLPQVGLFADGVAVAQIGQHTFDICKHYVDEVITVSNDEICAALKDIFEDTRAIAEPSGALSLAGLKKYAEERQLVGGRLAAILSGANVNFHNLRYVSERCEIGEKREGMLAVTIPERKGAFLDFCHRLGKRVVTEFNYRYSSADQATLFVGVRLSRGSEELRQIIDELQAAGYPVINMTDNDLAKNHVRYMVGGRPCATLSERLLSFEFPEQPGALLRFLETLGSRWNITLFHYRNHGADYGRVLCAFELVASDDDEFQQHLRELGYVWHDVSADPAYRLFLAP